MAVGRSVDEGNRDLLQNPATNPDLEQNAASHESPNDPSSLRKRQLSNLEMLNGARTCGKRGKASDKVDKDNDDAKECLGLDALPLDKGLGECEGMRDTGAAAKDCEGLVQPQSTTRQACWESARGDEYMSGETAGQGQDLKRVRKHIC